MGESRVLATVTTGRGHLDNPTWVAPEILDGKLTTEKADIFALGIILWELFTGRVPYSSHEVSKSVFVTKFEDAIIEGLRPEIPTDDCIPEYSKLIEVCWAQDPTARLEAKEVIETLKHIRAMYKL